MRRSPIGARSTRLGPFRAAALAFVCLLVPIAVFLLAGALPGPGGTSRAVAQPSGEAPTPQTNASVPASAATMIGATPEEPGRPGEDETWGVGSSSSSSSTSVLVRYYMHPAASGGEEGTWTLGPALPTGFKLAQSPLAGQMTPTGFGVLVGTAPGGTHGQVVLVRKPGGGFQETAHVPIEGEEPAPEKPLLGEGQRLFGLNRAPMIAPLQEESGEAGALLAPVSEGSGEAVEKQVLHWDGRRWSSEPIEIPAKSKEEFRVLAIGASTAKNAWLLARLSSAYPAGAVALFHRVEEAPERFNWQPVALQAGPGDEEAHPLTVPVVGSGAPPEGEPFDVPGATSTPVIRAQLLTVTSQGVWIDGARADIEAHVPASATLFFEPEGAGGGHVAASWCKLPAETPSGTPQCEHELPESLPIGPSRSIAWRGGSSPFGERVITGLPEGVSLRLAGESFTRVLALGGGDEAGKDPGAAYGAAFSSPTEGWLGEDAMPVHLTLKPQPSGLTPWPVPFRNPLLAIAPEPGAPVGALSSEALAVGVRGAVARFKPGIGWLPESLFGPGESVETKVSLRAVAWPTPNRAYAVGDEGEMWLWRGETGLWERDPATPIDFRANLVGIAFDPNEPTRGYAIGTQAVGQGGVLLRYGKTWTEETALPPQVQGAAFNSIVFAGSEAIVAYSRETSPSSNQYVGGLLVNEGSGWHVDQEAEAVAEGKVPRALAGLRDGGAAFVVSTATGQRVIEREAAGSPWQAVATPLPPSAPAGSLALFREGGALRAIVTAGGTSLSGSGGGSLAGLPPFLVPPSGVPSGAESGGVLRQTAAGWSDDGHELNPVEAPEGSFISYDQPYRPDPIFAVLIDPTGTQGWAVGGLLGSEERLDTANVERYPSDGVTPLGSRASSVPTFAGTATFAFGGGAQCGAPCADRELARAGPPVWLSSAVALAGSIGEGSGGSVGAFFDLGPTVTEGAYTGAQPPAIPYEHELGSYASILAASRVPTYDAIAPADLDARPESLGNEASWEAAFAGFPRPFGGSGTASPEEPGRCGTLVGCESAYYAVEKNGVWILVLDDSARGQVDQAQREWVEGRLGRAGSEGKPVIVVGNSNLATQIAAHDEEAINLFRALAGDNPDGSGDPEHYVASAYFYDSPEEDVQAPLVYNDQQLATFGTGTLGYELASHEQLGSFHGAKGILLGEVHSSERKPDDEAPVSVRMIPVVGELAVEAKQGILLRRSRPALFEGLARRPRGGCRAENGQSQCEEDQYTPIPSVCVGQGCQTAVLPEYEFSSSDREVGRFVERNTASSDPLTVLQNAKGEPIADEPEPGRPRTGQPQAGLFCPFNAGTTIVTLRAGGLSASLPVTVQPGSVREPCGTVPIKHQTAASAAAAPPAPPPAPAPAPVGPTPAGTAPVVPLPSPPLATPPPPARPVPATPAPFFIQPAIPFLVPAFVPPPLPAPAEPTPPTGTSAVTSPVEAAQKEEEEEEATESVSNQAMAYSAPEHEPAPGYILGIVLLAAFAGAATVRRRPRRGRRGVRVAPATLSGVHSQRRTTRSSQRRR